MMQLRSWKLWLLALVVLHGIIGCAGFFAPYNPAEQDRERPYLPPMRIHLVDAQGHFHFCPFVYAEQMRGGSFDQFEERTEQAIPFRFFVTGARYHLLGLLPSRMHFFGAEASRLYLLGSDAYGRDQLSRILYGGQISLLAGLLGAGLTLLIGVLSVSVTRDLVDNPVIPKDLKAQVDLDDIAFVSNDHLLEVLEETKAAPEQVTEAVRINTEGRSRALRICFLALTGLALVAIFPAGDLPGYDGAARARRRR